MTSNPIITLDDGSTLTFVVEEVEDGSCYGVAIIRHAKRKANKRG